MSAHGWVANQYSDYIVYVDESGDHGLETLDAHYPVFVLAFCVFHKSLYAHEVVPAIETFKFHHFGHDSIVLHEHEIRKEKGAFRFADRASKQAFLDKLTEIIRNSDFVLICCVIEKHRLREGAGLRDDNPYHVALGHCLEMLYELLRQKGQESMTTHVVVEGRGKREVRDLGLAFNSICDGSNRWRTNLPFRLVFADKKTNSSGLQLADLVARPVGLSVLRPAHRNRAFEVLKPKFFRNGLQFFPEPEKRKAPVNSPRPGADRDLPVH